MPEYRLLVVEDNQGIAAMICRAARDIGFDARQATGCDAMQVYQEMQPHILILDILMPEMDGLEFLQFLEESQSSTRIIILSGSSDIYRRIAEDQARARGLKVECNLAKPFRISEVRMLLENMAKTLSASSSVGAFSHG